MWHEARDSFCQLLTHVIVRLRRSWPFARLSLFCRCAMAVTVDECFWLHFCALLWVIPACGACGPKTKLFEGSPVGAMAAACGCHSVLSGTMCRRLCDCRVEGEERKELRGRRGQESRWVSRRGGHCPPNPAPLVPDTVYHTAAS
ncbi:hypothetical protein TcG_09728 [Trypanosoma cruzi]|nr:hypothetical protein TcG_09728 [Trypanosoma cruzi]